MALYLTERDVEHLLTMPEAVTALEETFRRQADGEVINQTRRRLHLPAGTFHTMVAADLGLNTFGMKAYTAFAPKTRFLVLLYNAENGDLLALIEADRLGQMRTGAASGVATQYLARQDRPLRVGIFGAGWQAHSQLPAMCAVRSVQSILVYSRNENHRAAFSAEMTEHLGVPVSPVDRPEAAAEGMDMVITATTAREPVLRGEWLAPGTHVNVVGGNLLSRREVDEETIRRSSVVAVDSIAQARLESGDLLIPYERRLFRWEQAVELSDIVAGRHPGRTDDRQITLFKSTGVALEDIAVATLVYKKALSAHIGTDVPLWKS